MPLRAFIPLTPGRADAGGTYLWHITEDTAELERRARLTSGERARLETLHPEKRRREWLAVRALLREHAGPELTIAYTPAGAPRLEKGWLSISHTDGYAALLYAPAPCGLDIESPARDFSRTARRFVNETEASFRRELPPNFFHALLWCAKEAAYKRMGIPGLDFRRDLLLTALDPEEKRLQLACRGETLGLSYHERDEILLVTCL